MKIFVLYNNDYSEKDYASFSKGIDNLKRLGHNVKSDLDFRSSVKKGDEKSFIKYQTKVEKAMRDTDIVVVDVTNADAKVGFDIAYAISEKKIVLAMYEGDTTKIDTLPLQGSKARNLNLISYTDSSIVETLKDAVDEAKGKLDTKFILIISPEIDRYLDWASATKRMHKAQIVRNSIESVIKKDREYKNFLNG
ncbi:hypothetical protein KC678_04000 [Candidatus Dojkabacteria bacterium]|uniref:Nucleoside 2-deoxyribosyltransferase n=1 Tax=Candidatus Dojkabacteria bacterium TaxID=2099670 RepID=A0A955RGP2_9BACT|nr:hypothetical protein [Candidatus Dojkabacteria bacterium]